MSKNHNAQALRAIPSSKRTEQSRINGRMGGRPRTKPPSDPDTVLAHADGTITYWNARQSRWHVRIAAVSARELATLPPGQRTTIVKLLAPHPST